MSTPFKPKPVCGEDEAQYDSLAALEETFYREGDVKALLACENELTRLDAEWKKQGEP